MHKERRLLFVAVFAAMTALAGLWSLPPLDRDEARFAQAAAQMLETGDFISIRFQDQERNKKPAGIYWLQAASVAAFSNVEDREIWAYRLPSMAGAILAAIFTYLTAARLYDRRTGFLAGLLIASAPLVAVEATMAKTDAVLLSLVCLTQLSLAHIYARLQEARKAGWRWPVLFWAAQGASILIKGPVAPLVSLLTGLGLINGKAQHLRISAMRPVTGVLILILIVAPWAVAIEIATNGRFFLESISVDLFEKIGAIQEGHQGLPGYHALFAFALFWPAAALMIPGLMRVWRERQTWQAWFLLSWLVPAWLVFELISTKLPHYVLPLYPALAIIAAHAAVCDAGRITRPQKLGAGLYAVIGFSAAGLIAILPVYFNEKSLTLFSLIAAALIVGASILIAFFFWRGRTEDGTRAAAVLSALYAWVMLTGVLPNLPALAISPRLAVALEQADQGLFYDKRLPVAIAGYSEPSAVFLLGGDTILTNGADAGARLARGEISAAIIETDAQADFDRAVMSISDKLSALAVIDGFNYSKGKLVSLTIYKLKPAKDP